MALKKQETYHKSNLLFTLTYLFFSPKYENEDVTLKDGNRSVDSKFSVSEMHVDTALPSNAYYNAPKKA